MHSQQTPLLLQDIEVQVQLSLFTAALHSLIWQTPYIYEKSLSEKILPEMYDFSGLYVKN